MRACGALAPGRRAAGRERGERQVVERFVLGEGLGRRGAGLGAERVEKEGRKWVLPAMTVLGTVILYIVGTAWFMIQTKNTLGAALGLCVLPFLPGDAVKIAAVALITPAVKKGIHNL